MGDIIKVAVLPITNVHPPKSEPEKKLLLCRKKGLDHLITLGGKLEPGESDEECAVRECDEEAQCKVFGLEFLRIFYGERIDEPGSKIELRCYLGILMGSPSRNFNDKVYAFPEIDRHYKKQGHLLTPILEEQVIPYLIRSGRF